MTPLLRRARRSSMSVVSTSSSARRRFWLPLNFWRKWGTDSVEYHQPKASRNERPTPRSEVVTSFVSMLFSLLFYLTMLQILRPRQFCRGYFYQYSLGKRIVVTLLSASVMIQIYDCPCRVALTSPPLRSVASLAPKIMLA